MRNCKTILTVIAVLFAICTVLCPHEIAFAETFGETTATPVDRAPLGDGYFIAMLIFFALDVYEIVRVTILSVKLIKRKKIGLNVKSFVPYSVASLLPAGAFKGILVGEIVLFAVLYVICRILSSKLKKEK